MYDQVGCGDSSPDGDDVEWSIDASVRELAFVLTRIRDARAGSTLRTHVLGQSWGGILAFEAARAGALMSESDNVAVSSLVLSNTPSSVPQLEREAAALVEAAGSVDAFMDRHNCRDSASAPHVAAAYAKGGKPPWRGSGAIASWEAEGSLLPDGPAVMLVSGEHDFVTEVCVSPWFDHLPKGKETPWAVIEGGSHMPFNEGGGASDEYMRILRAFLAEHDGH